MQSKTILQAKLKAYTLTEILVVLCIIGILVLLALPNLLPLINRAKKVEAKEQLEHICTLEKTYFYEKSKYTTDLNALGFLQEKLSTEGGHANYRIEIINATNTTFTARATAVVDFNGNGVFNVWEADQDKNIREVTPN